MTRFTALIKLPNLPIWIETIPQETRAQAEAYALQILEETKIKVVRET